MKKNLKYLAYLMPLIFFISVNYSAKANIKKSTINKATVIELDEDNTFQSLYYKRFIPSENLRKDLPVFNISSDYFSIRKQKGDITKPNMILPNNHGSFYYSHTTSLVDSKSRPLNGTSKHAISSSKPYNAVGKIIMEKNGLPYTCSGALIGKAVVSTAAYCLARYGLDTAEKVYFIPAATSNISSNNYSGPIGIWKADKLYIPACYKKGNCESHSNGTINANNIALFTLKLKNEQTPYDKGAHYLNYGWNNAGFTNNKDNFRIINVKKRGQISTLGYPMYLGNNANNRGGSMIRTDSLAFVNIEKSKSGFGRKFEQYIWGSSKYTGGSNGSPVIINLGYQPNYDTLSISAGKYKTPNVVIGNLGWGYTNTSRHVLGGSPFGQNASYPDAKYKDKSGRNWGAGNIGFLMREVCGQGYGNGQSDGICLNR